MPESQEGGSGHHIWARRNFLGVAGWGAVLGAYGLGFAACVRLAFPRVLFEPMTSFKAGYPTEYSVGEVSTKWIADQRVWIVREPWGLYAVLAVNMGDGMAQV